MGEVLKKKIKEIIGDLECPRSFCCLEMGLEKACKTKDIGMELYVECLEEDGSLCPFSVSYGTHQYCSCPLRVHIAKNLEK